MAITRRVLLGAAASLPAFAARAANMSITYTGVAIADALPVFIAHERGLFARHGLDVTMVAGNGATIPAVLVSGTAQIGQMPPTTLLEAAQAGIDLVAVAACDATPHPSAVSLVVGTNAPVKQPADLRGRKIGVPGLNGTFHVLARVFLRQHGLDDGSVSIMEVPYPRMIDTLRAGAVDAVTAPRPYLDRILDLKAGWTMAELVRGTVPDGTVNILHASTRNWAAANGAAIAAFRAGLEDAIALIHAEPDNARAMLAQYTKLPPEVVADLPFLNYGWRMRPEGLAFWIDESLRQGLITRRPDAAALIAA